MRIWREFNGHGESLTNRDTANTGGRDMRIWREFNGHGEFNEQRHNKHRRQRYADMERV